LPVAGELHGEAPGAVSGRPKAQTFAKTMANGLWGVIKLPDERFSKA
jgi:hypothetical protein